MIADIIFKIIIGTAIGLIFGLLKILFERVGERPKGWEVNRDISKCEAETKELVDRLFKDHERKLQYLNDDSYQVRSDIYSLKSQLRFVEDRETFLKEHKGEPLTGEMFDKIRRM